MKIAITGGTGFLGEYVINELLNEGYEPVVLTREKLQEKNKNVEFRSTNYNLENLKDILKDVKALIHLAASRGSQGNISEFHDNEILTQNIYEVCADLKIKNIIYASSISVYSSLSELPWREEHVPEPLIMYGVSKLACENIGNIYSNKKGLNIKNLRLAHLYGFNEKNNYMINRFMREAFHKNTINLHTQSIAKREFLYAKEAAMGIVAFLRYEEIKGTFNLGSEEYLTNYEVAQKINKVFGNVDNITIENPEKYEDIHSSYMSSSKLEKSIGYKSQYDFEKALNEIFSLMKELENVPKLY